MKRPFPIRLDISSHQNLLYPYSKNKKGMAQAYSLMSCGGVLTSRAPVEIKIPQNDLQKNI